MWGMFKKCGAGPLRLEGRRRVKDEIRDLEKKRRGRSSAVWSGWQTEEEKYAWKKEGPEVLCASYKKETHIFEPIVRPQLE